MSLEEAGVPTVSVHTDVFVRLAKSVALANGMPTTRQAFVPQPLVGRTESELRAYIEEADPLTGRPFMQELIEGLSGPLNDNDLKSVSFERSTPRLLEPDTEDNLQDLFIENHWSDRLPVILALAASGQSARSSSTTSFAVLSVINGPIRNEIGMGDGIGAMGPYNHANATIGRAYNLLSQNLQGGSVPGDTYMGSLGNWYNYSATFAEAEERSPWRPFHVQHGFAPSDSTASVFFGGRYTIAGFGPRETWAEQFRRAFAACQHNLAPMLVMDPIVARAFVDLGFDTKEKLIDWCADNAQLPAREYWDDLWVQTLQRPLAVAGVEPHASRLAAGPDELVNMFEPHEISIVVAGGETQGAWKMIAGRHGENGTVSVDAWR